MRLLSLLAALLVVGSASAQKFDKQKLLDAQTFWDNRTGTGTRPNIPFFECPDADIDTTYYYRWELLTKHLTYGSPNCGLLVHRIHRPAVLVGGVRRDQLPGGASALRGAMAAATRAMPQDYARYWFKTPGAQPRRYSTWLADAVWAVHAGASGRGVHESAARSR